MSGIVDMMTGEVDYYPTRVEALHAFGFRCHASRMSHMFRLVLGDA